MSARLWTRSLAVATLLLIPTAALAQGGGPPPQGGRPGGMRGGPGGAMGHGPLMEVIDRNHDGVLSAEEIRGASQALQSLDRDHNGRIDRSELRPNLAGRGNANRQGGRMAGRAGGGGFGPPPGGPGGEGEGPPPGGPGGARFGPPPGGPGGEGFGPPPGGPGGQMRLPQVGDLMPPFVRAQLRLDPEKSRKIAELEAENRGRLKEILGEEQSREFEQLLRQGPPGARMGGGPPRGPGDADDGGPPVRPGRPD